MRGYGFWIAGWTIISTVLIADLIALFVTR